ncbi:DUF3769 domain-containing protein [Synechococcus sp. H60.2]|uniref:DUF3769 domain-containing protein n=1 Tax=Synechococcus sp. H60.2 TaxID=2964518 RepID=UPI0039C005C0
MKGFWWLWLCLGVFGLATAAPASAQKSRVAAAPPGATTDALAERTLRLRSDRQTFDQRAQVFLAEGNVEMRLGRSVLRADRLRIELQQRRAVAEGNVSIELDQQRIQGSRLEYDFGREQGFLEEAFGQVDIGQLQASGSPAAALSPRRLVRFRAVRIRFDANNWEGEQVRLTNDPLDPPELEIRSPRATSTLQADGSSLLIAEAGQLVFDQVLFLPLPIRLRFDSLNRQPPVSLFYDDFDREELRRGLILQANFELLQDPHLSLVLSPQLYPQRLWGSDQGIRDGIGLRADFRWRQPEANAQTSLFAELRGIVFEEFARRLRAQVEHRVTTGNGGQVTYTYAYQERFFSGRLGFQIVENRLGASYSSPTLRLGNTGLDFSYRIAADYIDALGQLGNIDTDPDLALAKTTERIQLARLQLGAALTRSFPLWRPPKTASDPPPRFSALPIEQGIWLNTGVSSSQSFYSNGRTQSYTAGSIGLDAVIGAFAANTFDYTNLRVTYSNGFLAGASPFLFDRITTREQLVLGFLQQLYGPLRVGAETTVDLQSGQQVDITYRLGYDRRTYGFSLQYNPVRQSGALELRVEGLNWEPSPAQPRPVTGSSLDEP